MSMKETSAPPAETKNKKSMAERIASLSPEQRALYEQKRRELQKKSETTRIPRLEGKGPWPASTDQAALWFIQQLEPGTSAYNIGNGFRMKGELDVALLEKCLNVVAQRHEILRSVFTTIEGRPYQVVTERKLSVPVIDVSHEAQPEKAAHAAVTRLIREPFDLEKGPVVRLPLVRIAKDDYVFVGVLHHIATDWWSYFVFYTELFGLYRAFSEGRPNPFRDLPIQYADWAAWRTRWEQSENFREQENYWLRMIAGAPHVLELPADRPRPAVQTHGGARVTFAPSAAITPRLRAMNRKAGTSSFMTLLAALNVFLWRYSGQQDFLVGTPVSADRDSDETSHLIGYMLNTLVLRADLSGNPDFLQVLERVRTVCMDSFANKEYPFRHLVDRLKLERDMSRMPLYQVEYLYISTESPVQQNPGSIEGKLDLPGFEMSDFGIDRKTSPVDLQVTFGESPDRIDMMFEYNTDIFEEASVRRMGNHLIGLLEAMLADPRRPICSIPLLSADEQRHVLSDFNPAATRPAYHSLPHRFEQQVQRTPGAIAVVFGEESLTYVQLNERANRLAHLLAEMGVTGDRLAGICMERSLEMLVSMLAVLKAGGAYLPLDPEYPEARLAHMLSDSAPVVVVTTKSLQTHLPPECRVVVSEDAQTILRLKDASAENPATQKQPQQAAYVIYTSGSTGVPKGVVIEHRALSVFLDSMNQSVGFDETTTHLAVTTIGFDISILELFLPLCHGSRVVLASREDARDPRRLCALVRSSNATSMQATPSHWGMLLQEEATCLKGLRVLSGGEALPGDLARRLYEASGRELYNVYGPTEATIWASAHKVTSADLAADALPLVTIGAPLAEYRMYVLDHCLDVRPVGVAGDLYIAGSALARGYLHRAALAAERFVADPFGPPGSRMYRTGDVARWSPDGTLEFLGRADHQIKLRGFRIELEEIEALLKSDPAVGQATVVVREDQPGAKQLVAYLTPANGTVPDSDVLRSVLGDRLPDYMVPSIFVTLDSMPLTPNGKVDRRALPAPERRVEAYRRPRTAEEEILCSIFADVLGLEQVGVENNFFTLGGHSLMATQFISQVRTKMGIELPLRALFEAPTVALLAPYLQRAEKVRVPLRRQQRPERLPLSHGQKRLWFLDQLEGGSPQYNLPEVLRLRGPLDMPALRAAMNAIVERHESLRTHFSYAEGEPFQVIEPRLFVDVPVIDLSGLEEAEQREQAFAALRQEWEQPFDLSRGPLLRMKLLRIGEEDHIFVRTFHHIVSDGWSQGVFNREFMLLYEAFAEGHENSLDTLPIQYADFALWQRRWLSEEVLERDLAYWKEKLSGIPEQLELPKDRPRQSRRTYNAEVCSVSISPQQVEKLKKLTHDNQATLYMTLVSAFSILLQRYSGQHDIVIGSPIAGRQEAQLEQMIGFFVNSLIMRVQPLPEKNFAGLLAEVRKTSLEAYQHQDLPFERLVEELSPERRLNAAPIFQVVFALQNAPEGASRLKGLKVEPVGVSELRVRIDLEVHAVEREGGIEMHWLYARDLFDRWRMEQMAGHYLRVIEAVVSWPQQTLSQIELLSSAERQQILEGWNNSSRPVGPATFVELFEKQSARTPQAAAILMDDRKVTYAELNAAANRLAHLLIAQGIGAEDMVALALPRSPEMIVALLAVMKAGAAYVPLDPRYPAERLKFMLADSGAALLLAVRETSGRLPAHSGLIVLDDQSTVAALNTHKQSNPTQAERKTPASVHHPAYVIYTSGSTGTPKGVAVTHAGIASLSQTRIERLGVNENSRVLQFASLSFDVSVVEFVSALTTGAALVLLHDEQRSGAALRDVIASQGVTHATLPPVVLPTLEDTGELPLPNLVVGGEAASGEVIARWSPGRRMINGYGPTETTVVATMSEPLSGNENPPIGKPVLNTRVYVLDEMLRPLPIGVAGELYIAGLSLARGYLGRPALTSERFVADPYGREETRMYRTGDLVRWRHDGNLEFLGRTDQQIKIRGFRVELGEIESALAQHPEVREAVVLARQDQGGEKQLVGYVVARQDQQTQAQAESAQVQRWQQVYDSLHQTTEASGKNLPFAGWASSYTGEPIPPNEMQIWVDETVARLRKLKPRRVLAVGCGTGLLLTDLAPECEKFVGADFSMEALRILEVKLKQRDELRHVELRHAFADDLSFAADGEFDLVLINSVIQYFPGAGYLARALTEAARVTCDGGHVFVGDVRSLPLLDAYHASVQAFKAAPETTLAELRQKISQSKLAEGELAVDPALFEAMRRNAGRITRVQVAPKAGDYDNEVSRFRYDVTLSIGGRHQRTDEPQRWIEWDAAGAWRDQVRDALKTGPQISVGVSGVRDARVASSVEAARLVHNVDKSMANAGQLRTASAASTGENLNAVFELAKSLGAGLAWQGFGSDGLYRVIFNPQWSPEEARDEVAVVDYSRFTNAPALNTGDAKMGRMLQDYLRQSLPDYMVPSIIMVLPSWPLSPSGKVDRQALPVPERHGETYRAPRDSQEEALCSIFAAVLSLDQVGIDDDFFALGGHSLLATRLVSQVRVALGVELALRTLFEAPTVSRLAPYVRKAQKVKAPLVRQPRPERLPVSFAQQRLWFIDQLEGNSTEYNMPAALRLRGALDIAALRKAVNAIVERHESLRTYFAEVDGQPVQIIAPASAVDLPIEDLSAFDENRQREIALKAIHEEWERPFDLANGPVLRMKLIRISDHDHLLLRNFHHIVSDGWSQGVFNHEFMVLYEAFHEGRPSPLEPLPVQYADFALWQRKWLNEETLQLELDYWKKQLEGIPEQLELPKDRPRQTMQTYAADVCHAMLPAPRVKALAQLAQANQATLYMTLLSVFSVLLQRYSGQQDIVVGSPIANRQEAQLEKLIGFFVNSLVMRVRVNPESSFNDLLAAVRATALEAYQHQDVPFERLVEQIAPERNLNITPIFQVVFAVQNAPMGTQTLKGLEIERLSGEELRVRFDLELHVFEHESGEIGFYWMYNKDLFDRWRMEQMARHYVALLQEAIAAPEAPLHTLQMLDSEERQMLLVELNATAEPVPDATLVRVFEKQAQENPQADAVISGSSSLSFCELNERANRLAHYLIAEGAGPETMVALALNRSAQLVVALLAVLKSGAAYVPVDVDAPESRVAHIFADAAPALVLTESGLRNRLPQSVSAVVVDTTDFNALMEKQPSHNVDDNDRRKALLREHPAYVIYTSGSTGQPKGVVVTHAGLMNYLQWSVREYRVGEGNGAPLHSSVSFDLAVTSIYPPLLAGKPVIVAAGQHDVESLAEVLENSSHLSLVKLTPAHLEILNNSLKPQQMKDAAQSFVIGGEALKFESLASWRVNAPEARLINEYGPTETVVGCAVYQVQNDDPSSGAVPIGRPIANTQLYVLDKNLHPAPIGVAGELYIAGAGLARGYLGRPSLTAERFVANPFGGGGERMYRSGDLARWKIDGTLEFLGRADKQLKIRGYRIEPGEIEAVLERHPQVADALVISGGIAAQPQLLGYVIPRQGEAEQAQAQSSQIAYWQQLYESTYGESDAATGDFNLAGWSSSYTGEAIPAQEMKIWVEETVARIQALQPRKVLEIGCGSGLLLTRIAPQTESYIGMDFSQEVLARLGKYVASRGDLSRVVLRHGLAHELSNMDDNSLDLVVINSVAQYFPNMDYLLRVLAEAVRVTQPSGHVFIGDVRSLSLLEAYHTSVQLAKADASIAVEELRNLIRQARLNEEELVIDAALFHEIARRWPKVGRTELSLKAGSYDNELSRFRYDVTLTMGEKQTIANPEKWLQWSDDGQWQQELHKALMENPGTSIGLRGIRDRRSSAAIEQVRALQSGRSATIEELQRIAASGEDPDAIMTFARSLGAEVQWQGFGSDGIYNAVFHAQRKPLETAGEAPRNYFNRYSNVPAQNAGVLELGRTLKDYLKQNLPAYMTPEAVMVVPSWPLTANGKVDYRALPAPMQERRESHRSPRTPQEQLLCKLFEEVLGLNRVGIDDNFFALGGHSLTATLLVSQVRSALGVELRIRTLFEAPTVAELVERLGVETSPDSAFDRMLPLRSRGSLPPLFCMHPAGGLSWVYAGFMRELDPQRPIYGLQASAVVSDEPLPASIPVMAQEYAAAIQQVQPKGPYHLLGWSFGGTLAHEVACRLKEQGAEVAFLAIMDNFPTVEGRPVPVETEEEVLVKAMDLLGIDKAELAGKPVTFSAVFEAAGRAGHIPPDFDERIARRTMEMMLHNAALKESFRSHVYDGDLLFFYADVKEGQHSTPEAWEPYVTGKIEVHTIHCRHYEMMQPDPLKQIGKILEDRLRQSIRSK